MKINYLKINGFGKLENTEIDLSDKINLIYGKNEAGKTSLLKFISGMFYGVSKNKNKKEYSDYDRYTPWKAEEFSGKIRYKLDNNEEYEVFRDFSKKNPKIYSNGEDISKNYTIDKNKGNDFFYEQTKIDEGMFLSTSLIEQKGVVLDNSEQAVLTQKIANILSTGEENISYKKTMEKLNKKMVEEVGSERTTGRPLNIIDEKIDKLNNEKNMMQIDADNLSNIELKSENTNNKIKEKEIKVKLIKEIREKLEENNSDEEKIRIKTELLEEEKEKINNIKNTMTDEEVDNKGILIYYIILGILIIINLILFIIKSNKIINIILTLITVLFLIFIIIRKIFKKKSKENINNEYLAKIKLINENIDKINNNIKTINEEKIEKNRINEEKIEKNYKNEIDGEEIRYLFNEDLNSINKILDNLENEISTLKIQLYTNEIDYKNIINKFEEKAKVEEKLQACLEEKEELQKLEKSINIAREALENAYNKMKKEITPQFTKDLSNIVEQISSGKYKSVKYVDGEGLIIELENGEYINANKLSIGTIDQLYLSLRLSAMKEITDENMPIILDETFAYYDNERLENIIKYLNRISENHQIIIFTCSNREKEIIENNKIQCNYINLT